MIPLNALLSRCKEGFESVRLEVCELVIRDLQILIFVALLPDSKLYRIDSDEHFENVASNAGCAPLETTTVDLEEIRGCTVEHDKSRTLGIVQMNLLIQTEGLKVSIGQPLNHDAIQGIIRPEQFRDCFAVRKRKAGRDLSDTELKILTGDLNCIHRMSLCRFRLHFGILECFPIGGNAIFFAIILPIVKYLFGLSEHPIISR